MRHPDFPVPPQTDSFASWEASLHLAFARRGERTVLATCRHQGPLRVQKALYPEGEGVCHAVMLHPPAGIAGGDVLDIDIELGADAHAVLTTPGATKWYKSLGRTATQRVAIRAEAGARLDWLPQENIVFNQARPIIDLTLDLAPGLPNVLLLRVLARRPEDARALLSQTWLALREPMHGVAGRPLRLWST